MKPFKKILLYVLLTAASLLLTGCAGSSSLNNVSSWPGMSVDENTVYVAYASSVQAVSDGNLLWQYPTEANKGLTFYAEPLIYGDHIYAGSYNNQVHMLNKADGSLVSTVVLSPTKNKVLASPTVLEETLLVPSSDGTVYAFDPQNLSAPKWKTRLSNEIWGSPVEIGSEIYVSSLDKRLNVLDAESGALIKNSPVNGAVMGDLVIHDHKVYFGTLGNEVSYYDTEKKEIIKLFETESEIWGAPLIDGDRILAADMQGNIYCNDLETGASNWKISAAAGQGVGIIANPVLLGDGNYLFAAENGTLLLFDKDGKSVNTRTTGSAILTTPHVQGDNVIVAFIPGEALLKSYTFDLKENWVYTLAAPGPVAEATAEPTATPVK